MYKWKKLVCQGFDTFGLKSLYKNPENPSSNDLILTNNLRSFQNSCVIETGLSDFHRMVVTHENIFWKVKTKSYKLRYYKSFEKKLFREELHELSNATLEENTDGFQEFIKIC